MREDNQRVPSRDDLLLILDVTWDLRELAENFWRRLPPAFPHVDAWR
jgi:hypothetical protein